MQLEKEKQAMVRSHRPILILIGCMVLALTIICPVGFQGLVPDADAKGSCNPHNEQVSGSDTGPAHFEGDTNGYGVAVGVFKGNIMPNLDPTAEIDSQGVVWVKFKAAITGANTSPSDGSISGDLVFKVIWGAIEGHPELNGHGIEFQADCITEVHVEWDSDDLEYHYEMEAKGTVMDLGNHDRDGGRQRVIASLDVSASRVNLQIEKFEHCTEYDIGFSLGSIESGSLISLTASLDCEGSSCTGEYHGREVASCPTPGGP
jgi:hypothetical protein